MYAVNQLLTNLAAAINPPENAPVSWRVFAEYAQQDVSLSNSLIAVLHATAIDPLLDDNFTFTVSAEFAISAQLGDLDFATFEAQVMDFYREFFEALKTQNRQNVLNNNGDIVGALLGYNLAGVDFDTDGNYYTAAIPCTLYLQA